MKLSKWAILRQCSVEGMARYTKKARSVVFYAYNLARRCDAEEILPEHLLLGIIATDKSLAHRVGLPTAAEVLAAFGISESHKRRHPQPNLSQAAKNVMCCAAQERERLGHVHSGSEHLLMGIIRVGDATAELLRRQHGISAEGVHRALYHQNRATHQNLSEPVRAYGY